MKTNDLNIAYLVAGFTVIMFLQRYNSGVYNEDGVYENMTPMKHDFIKDFVLQAFPLLFFSISSTEFFNPSDPLNSFVGRFGITIVGYMFYYVIVEPHLANKLPKF